MKQAVGEGEGSLGAWCWQTGAPPTQILSWPHRVGDQRGPGAGRKQGEGCGKLYLPSLSQESQVPRILIANKCAC